jgi:ankyrin repeat protein
MKNHVETKSKVKILYNLSRPKLIYIPTQSGFTALHFAAFDGSIDVVRYLLEECGANINAITNVRCCNLYPSN